MKSEHFGRHLSREITFELYVYALNRRPLELFFSRCYCVSIQTAIQIRITLKQHREENEMSDQEKQISLDTSTTNFTENTAENSSHTRSKTMNSTTKNPVLEFVLNVTETAKYIWQHYVEWIIDVSWGKLFLACLLTLIIGGLLSVHALANWLVIGSLLLKCFIGKEDHVTQAQTMKQTTEQFAEKTAEKKPDEES